MNIWLDDVRKAPKGWGHLHNIEDLKKVVEYMLQMKDLVIDKMSYDFHLNHPKLGIDVMKYQAELCIKYKTKRFWAKKVFYHSNDPNGIRIMKEFAEEFEKEIKSKLVENC